MLGLALRAKSEHTDKGPKTNGNSPGRGTKDGGPQETQKAINPHLATKGM